MSLSCHLKNCTLCTLGSEAIPLEGQGRENAKLMILTLYPSSSENKQRQHFPFNEGVLLENMLNSVALSTKQFYITTALKCSVPYGITPSKEQLETCTSSYLKEELRLIKPDCILALGSDIGKYLINSKFSITKDRGEFIYEGIPLYVTYHPRYLLRFPSLEVNSPKWQAWQDLINFKDLVDNGVPF